MGNTDESDWKPRANDELVEPFFGGLQVEASPPTPPARRWLARAGLLLLGLVVAIGLFEAYVRVFDPLGTSHFSNMKRYGSEAIEARLETERLFVHKPHLQIAMQGWEMRTDRFGLRGADVEHPKPADVRRLLFIGDSVTFGWGLQEEETLPAQVAAELNAGGLERFEAINAGHPQHDTTQEAVILFDVGFEYEPELVCLVWCGNGTLLTRSAGPTSKVGREDPEIEAELAHQARVKARLGRLKPVLPASVRFLSHVYTRLRTAKLQQARGSQAFDLDFLGVDRSEGWAAAKASILKMRAECEQRGVCFAVLSTDSTAELGEFCAAEGLAFAPIHPTQEERATGLRNSNADPHLNGRGNAIMARNTLAALREWGWLP